MSKAKNTHAPLPPGVSSLACPEIKAVWNDMTRIALQPGMSALQVLNELDDALRQQRLERLLQRRLVGSGLEQFWLLETFPFAEQPMIKEEKVMSLANTLSYIKSARNIILIGGTGVGKTGISSGLFVRAIEAGFSGYFVRLSRLLEERKKAAALLRQANLVRRYSKVDLLVLDEVGYSKMTPDDAAFLLELLTYRERKATIVTSNLGFSDWPTMLDDDTSQVIMSPIIDRLTQGAIFFDLRKAKSIRGGGRQDD